MALRSSANRRPAQQGTLGLAVSALELPDEDMLATVHAQDGLTISVKDHLSLPPRPLSPLDNGRRVTAVQGC